LLASIYTRSSNPNPNNKMDHPLLSYLEQEMLQFKEWYMEEDIDEERSLICEQIVSTVLKILKGIESATPPLPDKLRFSIYEYMEMFIEAVNDLPKEDEFTQHCNEAVGLVLDHRNQFFTSVNLYTFLKTFEKEVESNMFNRCNSVKQLVAEYEKLFLYVLNSDNMHRRELPHLLDAITDLINRLNSGNRQDMPVIKIATKSLINMLENVRVVILENNRPIALAMALHQRLGRESRLGDVGPDILSQIWHESLKIKDDVAINVPP